MNFKMKITIASLLLASLFWACQETALPEPFSVDKGFIEYQYDYQVTVNGAAQTRKGYKRANINQAFFALRDKSTLPVELAKFRQIELFFLTEGGDYKAASQPSGISSSQISLVDTLTDPTKIMPATYRISTQSYFTTNKNLACLSLKGALSIPKNDAFSETGYEGTFVGQDTRNVTVLYLGNDIYQVVANGIANSNIYNIYYTGRIQKGENIK
jgi:hypothetical protein